MMNLLTLALSTFSLVSMPMAVQAPAAQSPIVSQGLSATYRIGLDDEIKLVVADEAQFNNVYQVQGDGTITIPFIGSVAARGLTATELQENIRAALAKDFLRNPQVRAEVSKYGSQFVMVQGEVRQPGRIAMSGPMTLMEALAEAGSTSPNAGTMVTIARRPMADEGATPKDAENITVNLDDLRRGIAGADRPLVGGDIISVPKAETFYVSGRVKNVGIQNWEPGLTVSQAITKAGGIDDKGRDSGLKIRRIVDGKSKEVAVKMADIVLPNDQIIVANRRW
jgi:polysaccharide export outer membrane protein